MPGLDEAMTFGAVVLTLRNLLVGYSKECGYEEWQLARFKYDGVRALPKIASVYYKVSFPLSFSFAFALALVLVST